MTRGTGLTRRRALLGAATAGVGALAGCVGDEDTTDAETNGTAPPSDDTETTAEIPFRGQADAPVTLEVYTDFACPACASYDAQALDHIIAEYVDTGDVRYEHRDYPHPVADPESWWAASAAREVYLTDPDIFWEFKTALLARQDELRSHDALFADIASDLGLDGEDVQTAGEEQRHEELIWADRERAQSRNVGGTPGFVVDGVRLQSDADTLGGLLNDLEHELQAAIDDA